MAGNKFDAKSFNPQAFKYLMGRVPNLKMNEMRKSRALAPNRDIRSAFSSQSGTAYARVAMKDILSGEATNYDGQTDIVASSTKTFERGVVVIGRSKAWTEKDFSFDITGGEDFMANIAAQVAEYWEGIDQGTILSILKGIFSMTGAKNKDFVDKHTTNIASIGDGIMGATTLNSATNKACGANKKKFTMVFLHSDVATGLENMNLLVFLKQTDASGITRDLAIGTWNGKLVLVDDGMPCKEGYYDATAEEPGALKIVSDTVTPAAGEVKLADVTGYFGSKALAAGDYVVAGNEYTTYVLGDGAFDYENIGAKVPYEMSRNPAKNGGEDTLYTRQRKVFAPKGISYEKKVQASLSPTDVELENGSNWELVHSGESVAAQRSYIDHKSIPIVRIISRG